jgi:hypothetical protein
LQPKTEAGFVGSPGEKRQVGSTVIYKQNVQYRFHRLWRFVTGTYFSVPHIKFQDKFDRFADRRIVVYYQHMSFARSTCSHGSSKKQLAGQQTVAQTQQKTSQQRTES